MTKPATRVYQVSTSRRLRKLLVALYGRQRSRRTRVPRPVRYRRVTPAEILCFHRWRHRHGWSARQMARRAHRDHHSVTRWLDPQKAVRRLMTPPTPEHLADATALAALVADLETRDRLLAEIAAVRRARIARDLDARATRIGRLQQLSEGIGSR